ncbi:unnamed protein product [Protopolystoma xenopodis]|uniref:Uncharacterized protein n=1 Tax=Protopolystoma xenopodis TaxID=117903 RepID=A0A3S5B5Z0_9PLAT|nr:unnamed protein product [Protopolystoma xenopodis]
MGSAIPSSDIAPSTTSVSDSSMRPPVTVPLPITEINKQAIFKANETKNDITLPHKGSPLLISCRVARLESGHNLPNGSIRKDTITPSDPGPTSDDPSSTSDGGANAPSSPYAVAARLSKSMAEDALFRNPQAPPLAKKFKWKPAPIYIPPQVNLSYFYLG